MFDPLVGVAFLDRQHLFTGLQQIAVAALALGHRAGRAASQGLQVELLVGVIDEHQAVAAQAEGAATVFIDPAARGKAVRGQALRIRPAP